MILPPFVKDAIREGRNYIGSNEAPDYDPTDDKTRTWIVTKRFECRGCTGLHVEYRVNDKCRRRMKDIVLEADGTIY